MALTLGNFFYAILLCINAVAVLNEERFLRKIGWSAGKQDGFIENQASTKKKIVNLIYALVPLIIANVIVIIFELILG